MLIHTIKPWESFVPDMTQTNCGRPAGQLVKGGVCSLEAGLTCAQSWCRGSPLTAIQEGICQQYCGCPSVYTNCCWCTKASWLRGQTLGRETCKIDTRSRVIPACLATVASESHRDNLELPPQPRPRKCHATRMVHAIPDSGFVKAGVQAVMENPHFHKGWVIQDKPKKEEFNTNVAQIEI